MQKKGANISLKGYDDIFSTDQSRAEAQQERVQEIPLSELHPFEGHPFRVVDDPPRFLVFVRSKDADALDAICKEHQARALTKNEKPSVLAQLKKFKEIVAAIPKKVREKKQERDL